MKYTYQEWSESGSFANPEGTDVRYANGKRALEYGLRCWEDQHWKTGSEREDASLLVWKGYHRDVTDMYPDFKVYRGPRGGLRMEVI